ncbi:MAG: hypothetical protein JXA33_27495 [Anaerolineae bacterium]|nr:hypothetical protein [Anaerolineae bacterium]
MNHIYLSLENIESLKSSGSTNRKLADPLHDLFNPGSEPAIVIFYLFYSKMINNKGIFHQQLAVHQRLDENG